MRRWSPRWSPAGIHSAVVASSGIVNKDGAWAAALLAFVSSVLRGTEDIFLISVGGARGIPPFSSTPVSVMD
jgi:hypothetical protein